MGKKSGKRGPKPKAQPINQISRPKLPWNGDHGTGTLAAKAGTKMQAITSEDGSNPNRMAYRYRVSQIDKMEQKLSMRQLQAAKAIQDAYCRVDALSSGSALKEQVDASPKPDEVIASQVDAMSHLTFVMSAVPKAMRDVVEHVCWHNKAIRSLSGGGRGHYDRTADFKVALDLVANRLKY